MALLQAVLLSRTVAPGPQAVLLLVILLFAVSGSTVDRIAHRPAARGPIVPSRLFNRPPSGPVFDLTATSSSLFQTVSSPLPLLSTAH